jgi:hypothetical protein
LTKRLEREATAAKEAGLQEALRQLGVTDIKSGQAALAELKKRQDSEKTESERLAAENTELAKQAALVPALQQTVERRATAEFNALSGEHQQAVIGLAGDDPAKRLDTIENLRKGGLLKTEPVAPDPIQAGAETAPKAPAPAETPQPAESTNHQATYEGLLKRNPVEAAGYKLRYWSELHPKQ